MAQRNDPYRAFKFTVLIDDKFQGGFSEITGLEAEMEMEEYNEGGVNDYTHYFPKKMKYPRLIMKRGFVEKKGIWDWYKANIVQKAVTRKNITIILSDIYGKKKCTWQLLQASPVRWTGPELKADSSIVAVESFEFVHRGIEWVESST